MDSAPHDQAHTKSNRNFALYFRNFIFGVEDSLVSTVGLLSGIAIAGVPAPTIFLTGMVLIFVEGFSMGVGSFLSEDSGEAVIHQKEASSHITVRAAIIMFVSYFLAGFIPLAPYILFDVKMGFPISIIASLITLFILGLIAAHVSARNYLKTGIKMLLIGGVAIALGVGVALLLSSYNLAI